MTVNVIGVDDVHVGQVIVLRDVTDRNLAEYAMRTAEMLAATGKLAHAIAHEINNPLEALTNLVYLAQSGASEADVQTYLASASRELDRIGRIYAFGPVFRTDEPAPRFRCFCPSVAWNRVRLSRDHEDVFLDVGANHFSRHSSGNALV